ncbi:MarR family transcriptional regulator [Mycoplasmopsis synoviae]|uniref:MarR family transcriptional regulator n=1 Tax=Mycoplasmopsis synoviae TaxID=2109 RepID=A0AAX3EZB5_MYCSY|nr:MarR family transcriptional regulator [Mycoplasmopsis synoviae]UZW64358.1 MarR family transcriptional regulator [Mycoplasmopsis synoviae]
MLIPQQFPIEILEKALHYTDSEKNPAFEAFQGSNFWEFQTGAKGVSKSFNGAIITIFRIVNDKRFNSIWCRNRYKHIKLTLVPTFKKALDFLAETFNLDYRNFFKFYDEKIFWTFEDGGEGRGIYFANWENIQSFQGLTLPKTTFLWGELVIDEPVEDPKDADLNLLKKLYAAQEENLHLILQNTVLRQNAPEDFKIKVKFFYNIFTLDHFLVQNFHLKIIPFVNEEKKLNQKIVEELNQNTFLMKWDFEFQNVGAVVIMYSKNFVPKSTISKIQQAQFDELKKTNYRLWLITVAGLSYFEENPNQHYFLKNFIFEENGEINKNICFLSNNEVDEKIRMGELQGVFYGYDAGKIDNAALSICLLFDNEIVFFDGFEDIKINLKKPVKLIEVHNHLLNLIQKYNQYFLNLLKHAKKYNIFFNYQNFYSHLDIDSETEFQILREKIEAENLPILIQKALRKKMKIGDYSIPGRQKKQQFLISSKKIKFNQNSKSLKLLQNLSKQVVLTGEEKRDESIHPEIYDFINAFEYSINRLWRIFLTNENERILNG